MLDNLLSAADITIAELSRRLGISQQAIHKWRKAGVPRYAIAYLELLAKVKRFTASI